MLDSSSSKSEHLRGTISLSKVADFVGYTRNRIRTGKSWGRSTPQFIGYARTKAPQSSFHHSALIGKLATYFREERGSRYNQCHGLHSEYESTHTSSSPSNSRWHESTIEPRSNWSYQTQISSRKLRSEHRATINLSITAHFVGCARKRSGEYWWKMYSTLRRICPNPDVLVLKDDLPNHTSSLVIFGPTNNIAIEKLQYLVFSNLLASGEGHWRKKRQISFKPRTTTTELILLTPLRPRVAVEKTHNKSKGLADDDLEPASHVDALWEVASKGEDMTG
ncbi:hypothetical protein PSTT_00548 [Puccinia striiformis]|uniref:Uncharacterized protein n=1 Tax=Puccinia striiformis TaxID=27350 RepID=A0A2S4W623_9BASI|nr:hypothetical protein PSTT_00548 [Puccinia striiformis]